ncbi:MAG: hypothetical protein QF926_03485 [Alphaproteobacteria bacterium]|jgi:protein ImuA|nr:hypothetical protein [Alphaproteobacteria bacterium]
MSRRAHAAVLSDLRARIRALETTPAWARSEVAATAVPFGIGAIDSALPWSGLPRACLHEIEGGGGDAGAATGFAAALLARLIADRGPALWCLGRVDLHGPGLAAFGLDAGRLIVVRARTPEQVLWVLEEGLRARRLGAVLGEVGGIDLTASRRLQLAAQASGTTCLLLYRTRRARAPATAAQTRWRVGPAPGAPAPGFDAPDASRWRVELTRCRGAAGARHWSIEWSHETHRFAVAAPLADRSGTPADIGLGQAV